jgi:hypothetical protein
MNFGGSRLGFWFIKPVGTTTTTTTTTLATTTTTTLATTTTTTLATTTTTTLATTTTPIPAALLTYSWSSGASIYEINYDGIHPTFKDLNITTSGIADGTTIYWKANFSIPTSGGGAYAAQLALTSGSFTINSGAGTFRVTAVKDSANLVDRAFSIDLGTTAGGTQLLKDDNDPLITIRYVETTTTTTTTTAVPIGPLGFNGKTYSFIKSTSGVAKLTLRFFDNGVWQIIPSNTGNAPVPGNDLASWALVTGNWYPTTTGIGAGYLYRVQTTSKALNGNGYVYPYSTDLGPWLPFTLTGSPELAYAAITAGAGDEAFGDFTVEIAINNSGSAGTIVSTSILSLNGSRGA